MFPSCAVWDGYSDLTASSATAEPPTRVATPTTASEPTRKGPPPAGPGAPPGVRTPDERPPGTRKKGTPEHDLGAVGRGVPKPPRPQPKKRR